MGLAAKLAAASTSTDARSSPQSPHTDPNMRRGMVDNEHARANTEVTQQDVVHGETNAYKRLLQVCVDDNKLYEFYPTDSATLDRIAKAAPLKIAELVDRWKLHPEIARDLVKLALYDVVLYIDDSGSMAVQEDGRRIEDLKRILERVAFAAALFDDDGLQVRCMNSKVQGDGIRSAREAEDLVARVKFNDLTPLGTQLEVKVIRPLVLEPAQASTLRKPVLVIIITDGVPTDKTQRKLQNVIFAASSWLRGQRYGRGALAIQFAQVGNDFEARDFLKALDEDAKIGDIVDCTSSFEVEQDEMLGANPPVNLTPDMWMAKLLLGSIDHSYDQQDDSRKGQPVQQSKVSTFSRLKKKWLGAKR